MGQYQQQMHPQLPPTTWYPSIGEQDSEFPAGKPAKLPFPSCVPEFFADTNERHHT